MSSDSFPPGIWGTAWRKNRTERCDLIQLQSYWSHTDLGGFFNLADGNWSGCGPPSRQLCNEVRVQSWAITKSSIGLPTSMLPLPTSDQGMCKWLKVLYDGYQFSHSGASSVNNQCQSLDGSGHGVRNAQLFKPEGWQHKQIELRQSPIYYWKPQL
jgi:hypothetical protein